MGNIFTRTRGFLVKTVKLAGCLTRRRRLTAPKRIPEQVCSRQFPQNTPFRCISTGSNSNGGRGNDIVNDGRSFYSQSNSVGDAASRVDSHGQADSLARLPQRC